MVVFATLGIRTVWPFWSSVASTMCHILGIQSYHKTLMLLVFRQTFNIYTLSAVLKVLKNRLRALMLSLTFINFKPIQNYSY